MRGKLNPHPTLSKDGNHKYDGDGHKWQLSAQLEKKRKRKNKMETDACTIKRGPNWTMMHSESMQNYL